LAVKKGSASMSPERVDRSPNSLYQDPRLISAARRGNLGRLNKLLAKLAKEQTPANKRRPLSSENSSD
jgi:hypothetical protein